MNKARLLGGLAVVLALAGAMLLLGGRAGLSGVWAALLPGKEKKPEVTLQFLPSEVATPQMRALDRVVQFSGPLVAPNSAVLRSKAAGTLLELDVVEGSRVYAGQVLGRIDAAEIGSRIAERRAMLESARAQAAQAARTHAINQRLADQQFISATALDNSGAALQTATAQLDAAQASLDSLRVMQRETSLVAPISGIVAKRFVLPGEKLSLEQQVLSIVSLLRLELAGSVGTHEVALLAPGMPVQLRVEGLDQPVDGRLLRIAPAADAGSRSIGVAVGIANPSETLRAGQYAVAVVTLADSQLRLTLPAGAIFEDAGQQLVWLLADGRLQRRAVTTGRRDERAGLVEVLQGVAPGMQVLAMRFDNLREGSKAGVVAQRVGPLAAAAASAALR